MSVGLVSFTGKRPTELLDHCIKSACDTITFSSGPDVRRFDIQGKRLEDLKRIYDLAVDEIGKAQNKKGRHLYYLHIEAESVAKLVAQGVWKVIISSGDNE